MKFRTLCKIFATMLFALPATSHSSPFEPVSSVKNVLNIEQIRTDIVNSYSGKLPQEWGETVFGVKTRIKGGEKKIALTFDACGSAKGMRLDRRLTDFLEKEKIPATLFVNGRWIDANRAEFERLARNPLFEIANHGSQHKPASVNGKSVYGIAGTANITEMVDEVELNARKITAVTGVRPKFYRSGTAYYDEIAVRISNKLDHQVAGFSLLGDAGATFSAAKVKNALLAAKGGDVAIMHFNHPESGTAQGVMDAVPELLKRGYSFVRLSDVELE